MKQEFAIEYNNEIWLVSEEVSAINITDGIPIDKIWLNDTVDTAYLDSLAERANTKICKRTIYNEVAFLGNELVNWCWRDHLKKYQKELRWVSNAINDKCYSLALRMLEDVCFCYKDEYERRLINTRNEENYLQLTLLINKLRSITSSELMG